MASAFGHAFTAIALATSVNKSFNRWKFWTIGAVCSVLPDADVISFKFGIPYESIWGHRGFSHSLLFALLIGILCTTMFYRGAVKSWKRGVLIFYFTLCTVSHSILDAMTNGGLGVAFFAPWDNSRYFLPWRPIKVSPIGIENFFTERGLKVLQSEAMWIGLPCIIFIVCSFMIRRFLASKKLKQQGIKGI